MLLTGGIFLVSLFYPFSIPYLITKPRLRRHRLADIPARSHVAQFTLRRWRTTRSENIRWRN